MRGPVAHAGSSSMTSLRAFAARTASGPGVYDIESGPGGYDVVRGPEGYDVVRGPEGYDVVRPSGPLTTS